MLSTFHLFIIPCMAAYLLTWTTYGTWLPGDQRGWMDKHQPGVRQKAEPQREISARFRMTETAIILDNHQRRQAEESLIDTCAYRGWKLRAYSVATNHVHLVISIPDNLSPMESLRIFKSYASKTLNNNHSPQRRHWWTRGGSARRLFDPAAIDAAIRYVENQSGK